MRAGRLYWSCKMQHTLLQKRCLWKVQWTSHVFELRLLRACSDGTRRRSPLHLHPEGMHQDWISCRRSTIASSLMIDAGGQALLIMQDATHPPPETLPLKGSMNQPCVWVTTSASMLRRQEPLRFRPAAMSWIDLSTRLSIMNTNNIDLYDRQHGRQQMTQVGIHKPVLQHLNSSPFR
jgi:hypothetical protein